MRFIDTNVFVYAATVHPRFEEVAKRILERIEAGEAAITSTLVLCEVAWVLEAMVSKATLNLHSKKILFYKSLKVVNLRRSLMGANNMM
jgi:predicted nucleic acid-binding protein